MTKHADFHRPGIAPHFARVLAARATREGVSAARLRTVLESTGEPVSGAGGSARISPAQLGALMRLVWRELDDELMGFGRGRHRFGVFALMARQMVNSPTLGEALRFSVQFYNLTSSALRWRLDPQSGRLYLELADPGEDPEHLLEEFLLLVWHRFSNWLVGERIPLLETGLAFPRPGHAAEYRLMFPGPVSYDHACSFIAFDPDWMASPVIRGRRDLRRYLQRLPDEWFIKQVFDGSASARVLRALTQAQGDLSLEALAAQWRISSRTLHRQLRRDGNSFRRLREQVRRERAESLLRESNRPVGEVARLVGMTEPALSRAFKQWTGLSPMAFRRAHRQ